MRQYGDHTGTEEPADGLRHCVRGDRCAGRETVLEDGRLVVHPASTYAPFCTADRGMIRGCLDQLPGFYRDLAARIGDMGQGSGPRVSGGGRTSRLPINVGVEAFQRYLGDMVLSWEERVRDVAHLAPVTTRHVTARAVTRACGTLCAHIDVLLALPADAMARSLDLARREQIPAEVTGWVHPAAGWIWYVDDLSGTEAGFEVLNLHHRCLARLGWTPQHHDLLSACWECENGSSLRRWDGTAGLADEVKCRTCGTEYVGERLRLLMTEEERLHCSRRRKVPAVERSA